MDAIVGIYNSTKFLSTPSARRATCASLVALCNPIGISIHALCEEGDDVDVLVRVGVVISIHALCEEGDLPLTPSVQRSAISIHALCEEGDSVQQTRGQAASSISIHALCEEGDRRGVDFPRRRW